MFDDEHQVKDLAAAIQRGDRDGAFMALDVIIRDTEQPDVVRHWIDCAKATAR